MNIILYLINIIQHQSEQIAFLLKFIRKFIPIHQWVHDDPRSPKYQKFRTNTLPNIIPFLKQDWQSLIAYYKHKYGKELKPVRSRGGHKIPDNKFCTVFGDRVQYQCKVCGTTFISLVDFFKMDLRSLPKNASCPCASLCTSICNFPLEKHLKQ